MKSLFELETHQDILNRIEKLNENTQSQRGQMQYKHLDHHLTQFGV